ncbi:hypothetical protein FRC09_007570 [Ceratobasidium sp. 395]|nr:hypothetical protein FRC09_007570 [Ceratobasidium sp. 395]
MDYNMWARQQQEGVARTWAALHREEDEIEHEEAVVVMLGQRLSQLRDRIQLSPRTHLDALLHQIAKDENRMLQSIDAVGARLAHEKAVFQREVQRISHSKANTSRSDRHTRAAWDYAEQIWRHEEAQVQERIERVSAMGMECRRRLAASARRRPSTAAVDAEPPAEELQRTPRERRQSTKTLHTSPPTKISSHVSSPPTTADRFIRERRPSNVVPSSAPAPAAPISSREFVRERRPSAAVPTSRPVTAAANVRPATAAARPYQPAEEKDISRPRERERERDRDRDRDRERDREREPRDRERERADREPRDRDRDRAERDRERAERAQERDHHRERTRSTVQSDDRMRTAAAWTAYECRWAGLQSPIPSAPTTPLTFHNVPWPVGFQPDSPRSLTPDRIKKFLLSPNHSPHRSPKERLKSALSLWRPEQWEDKWINSVEPSERDKVRYGVNVVAQCIGELLKDARSSH